MAKCGGVDYSWGADGLAKAHDYIITLLLYIVYLCYAIAGIVAVIASLQIYIKMNVGEEGVPPSSCPPCSDTNSKKTQMRK
jgi:hypothetical protein